MSPPVCSGGLRFSDLGEGSKEADRFQENLLKVMMSIEETFFHLAEGCTQNCIIICDRGTMDASAFVTEEAWKKILDNNGLNLVDIRDNRYNQVIHLVSAAEGAEEYYTLEDNQCRTEGIELARERDRRAAEAWVGHPYIDVVDNSTNFQAKMRRLIAAVSRRVGIDTYDRLDPHSRKLKFLVKDFPPDEVFPIFQDFDVIHDYLVTPPNSGYQARLRKRGQKGKWSYMHTQRRVDAKGQIIEVKRPLSQKDYMVVCAQNLLAQRDSTHHTIYKLRRCFIWNNIYFQLDVYKSPCIPRCQGLILLETYTTIPSEQLSSQLPPFLNVSKEITKDPNYSMHYLSQVDYGTLPNGHPTNI
ncbi:unc-132 [Cordylochernes scorpioides]|uniref:Unc-132 n=1 Tax=Cordylochernes scorpioides TaxID=51811 RepID=A0ABY6K3F5_9ARAC|nr:unc-132 [Cordylochernes scorpioides]